MNLKLRCNCGCFLPSVNTASANCVAVIRACNWCHQQWKVTVSGLNIPFTVTMRLYNPVDGQPDLPINL